MFRSSSVKAETGIGDPEDGSVFHHSQYYYVDSPAIQQHIEQKPNAFNVHGDADVGGHLGYQSPSRLPPDFPIGIKKEPQDPDCEYAELRSPVETEYGQIPIHQMAPSQTKHGVSLEQIKLEIPNEDCSDNSKMDTLKKEYAACKSEETFFLSHNLHANTAPVPVTLYGNQAQGAAMTSHEDLASADSESTPEDERVFLGLPVIRSHEKTVENNAGQCVDKPYACSSCDYSKTSRKDSLARPMISHREGKPQWDNRYDEAALTTHDVTQPETRDHAKGYTGEKPYTCPYCDHRFGIKFSLTRHMRKHTDKQLFGCSRCESRFTNNSDLVEHTCTITHAGVKPFECSICDFKATRNDSFVIHMRSHTGERPFECAICEFRTTRKSNLDVHMKAHTGEKPFECSMCDYKATRNSSLVQHVRVHTGEKPFKCSLCDYRTSFRGQLVRHNRTHIGEKHHKCSLCDYRTVNSSHLTRHMRKHTGEKPYTCSYCDYRCVDKSMLDRHSRKHTGDKPFKCSSCEKTFSQKCNLVKHARQHTGIKPYMCSKCDYSAADKGNLVKHMAKH